MPISVRLDLAESLWSADGVEAMNRIDKIWWGLIPSLRNLRSATDPTSSVRQSIDVTAAYENELARQKRWALWSRVILSSALVGLTFVIVAGYTLHLGWVGVTQTSGNTLKSYKTVWNWLQLLIIPGALAWGALWFGHKDRRLEWQVNSYNQRQAREKALDDLRDKALSEYFDQMSKLLLDRDLTGSAPDAHVRGVARALTLSVLERLDGSRKAPVIRFLHERHLIDRAAPVVRLQGANLTELDLCQSLLSGDNFAGTDLSGTHGQGVNLTRANLTNADLSRTQFQSPVLEGTVFSGADLRDSVWLFANLGTCNLHGAQVQNFHCLSPSGDFTLHGQADGDIAVQRMGKEH